MAHHKSAIKRIRQTRKRRLYNRLYKKSLREAIKAVRLSTEFEDGMEKFRKATSILDRASAKRILHKNAAANRKSSLARHVMSLKNS